LDPLHAAAGSSGQHAPHTSSIAGYCVPLFVFGVFTEIETRVPAALYPYAYALKLCAVMLALYACRRTLQDVRPSARVVASALLIGLIVCVQWVWLDKWLPYPHLGSRVGFNPLEAFQSPLAVAAFLFVRFWGLVVIVPVMEELFWRSFLIRYLTNQDFTTIPIGQFSPMAFWLVAGFSGLAHPEWLVAIVASAAYSWLLGRTGSLFATVLAHAVTNAVLGIYVLSTHDWQYW
jgi:CAAX prenyl protease-like protein